MARPASADEATMDPSDGANRAAGNAIGRYPALDGLRGFALLMMLGMHFGFYPSFYSPAPQSIATLYMAKIFAGGWISLDLFFVLSGFLITGILLASKGKPRYFQNFYGRRAVRIFPLYYSVLVVGLFIAPALFGERWDRFMGDTWPKQAWLWAYSMNNAVTFGAMHDPGMFLHAWSLAVEEQYYFVWPLLLVLAAAAARRRGRPSRLAVAATPRRRCLTSGRSCRDPRRRSPTFQPRRQHRRRTRRRQRRLPSHSSSPASRAGGTISSPGCVVKGSASSRRRWVMRSPWPSPAAAT